MAVIQFKRGSSERWNELNPILSDGEPGYDSTQGRLKIGDGKTAWDKLRFQDEHAVISRSTRFEFPSHGESYTIYKDESAQLLYQWVEDGIDSTYKVLGNVIGTGNVLDINIINGGNSNGTT